MRRRTERHRSGRVVWPRPSISVTSGLAALVALLATAVAAVLLTTPAEAASTLEVQLTLSGVASPDNPTGGSQVGVHPGDSVVMRAAAIPSAGAPAGLSGSLSDVVGGVANLQVRILAGNNLPGLHGKAFTLRAAANCAGAKNSLPLHSLGKGTYSFKYVVQKISLADVLVGIISNKQCTATAVSPRRDQLGTLTQNNVKVTDNAVYTGSIVVATNPPGGQIGIQLPNQSISVKAGPVHTSVNLPGATVGVPNPVPGITSNLPQPPGLPGSGAGNGGSNGGGKHGSDGVNYTPPSLTVPQEVMPHAVNVGGSGRYVAADTLPGRSVGGHIVAPPQKVTATAATPADPSNVANAGLTKHPVDLGSKNDGGLFGKQVPVILAILAILALSLVTAGYARMVLLRRH